jgi:hypothetical protein
MAHSVAYADCFATVLGVREKTKVVTGDQEIRRFEESLEVGLIK